MAPSGFGPSPLAYATMSSQPSGGMMEHGEVAVSIFFHGQKFQPMSRSSYIWNAVASQSVLFSPPSPM